MQRIPLWFLLGVFLLTSCNMPFAHTGETSVWFDVPLSGLTVPVNSPVHIEGHAASSAGVSKVNIWVNDDLLTSVENPPAKDDLSYFEATWIPASPGEFTLSAAAVNKNGLSSQTDKVKITVNRRRWDNHPDRSTSGYQHQPNGDGYPGDFTHPNPHTDNDSQHHSHQTASPNQHFYSTSTAAGYPGSPGSQ